jgi:hypothetical protein
MSLVLVSVNDNGDAKFKEFTILPPRALVGTTLAIDFAYESKNGTGTGELYIEIDCVDKIKLYSRLLNEAQKPGTYGDRLALDASPDPDCDPTEGELIDMVRSRSNHSLGQCEQWLPGTYHVTVQLCNGICGSHHPHSSTYDTAVGTFILYD